MKQCDNWGTFAKVADKPFTILSEDKQVWHRYLKFQQTGTSLEFVFQNYEAKAVHVIKVALRRSELLCCMRGSS